MPDIGFGLWMTVTGMGTVFGLLLLLWFVLWLIGWVDKRQSLRSAAGPAAAVAPADGGFSSDEVVAITVAVLAQLRSGRAGGEPSGPSAGVHAPGDRLHSSRWVSVGRALQHRPWTRGR